MSSAPFARVLRTFALLTIPLVAPLAPAGCAHAPIAPGMVSGEATGTMSALIPVPQNADSSFKGMPGDPAGERSIPGDLPQGAGYNQAPGELRPQMAGDVHYHVHYHGTGGNPGPDGFAQPQYGAPRMNGNLGRFNQGQRQAPLGTGGGGAGWYGPDGGPGGSPYGGWHGGWGPWAGGWGGGGWGGNWNGWHGGWTD